MVSFPAWCRTSSEDSSSARESGINWTRNKTDNPGPTWPSELGYRPNPRWKCGFSGGKTATVLDTESLFLSSSCVSMTLSRVSEGSWHLSIYLSRLCWRVSGHPNCANFPISEPYLSWYCFEQIFDFRRFRSRIFQKLKSCIFHFVQLPLNGLMFLIF